MPINSYHKYQISERERERERERELYFVLFFFALHGLLASSFIKRKVSVHDHTSRTKIP